MNDRTAEKEREIQKEQKPSFRHLLLLFLYVFRTTKGISCIYLGLFVLLSFLRPLIAEIWGRYISVVENAGNRVTEAALMLVLYWGISFAADLLESYLAPEGGGDFEQLDLVQANRQQELFKVHLLKKVNSVSPEYLEAPMMKDRMCQVFDFAGDSWNGINRKVMISGYVVVAKVISVLTIAAALYLYHPLLSVLVLLAPLPTLYSVSLGERLQFRFVKESTELQRETEYFEELLLSPAEKEIKTLGLHDFFYGKWRERADAYVIRQKKLIRNRALLQIVNSLFYNVAHVGGMVLAILLLAQGKLSLGAMSAVFAMTGTLITDSAQLIRAFGSFQAQKNRAAQFFDLMDLKEDETLESEKVSLHRAEAKGVKYRYLLTTRYTLNGVDFTLHPGEKVAFVGENGAGKSTFVKLLTGMLSPSEGTLLLNGKPTEELHPESRFDAQSVVVQDPTHYETFTLYENVFLGETHQRYEEKAIERALAFSGLSALENKLLGKYVGGTDLSGGQWQKLAIARAAYRNRDLIVLDEPTSNLDPLAETEIFEKYNSLAKDKTVIYVTHRISVARLADRIIVFKNGKIEEDGSFDELMQLQGEFARLYEVQSQWYDR